jgi:hypothetical protein
VSQGAKRTADNQNYARLKNLLAALCIKKGIAKKNGVKGRRAGCVVAVYESPAGRGRAVSFCEVFRNQSGAQVEPAVRGFSFGSLNFTTESVEALKNAVKADLIIFAVTSVGDLPPEVRLWTQHGLGKRCEREGSLVGLILGEAVHPGEMLSEGNFSPPSGPSHGRGSSLAGSTDDSEEIT